MQMQMSQMEIINPNLRLILDGRRRHQEVADVLGWFGGTRV